MRDVANYGPAAHRKYFYVDQSASANVSAIVLYISINIPNWH